MRSRAFQHQGTCCTGVSEWKELYQLTSINIVEDYIHNFCNGKVRDKRFKYPSPFSEFYRPRTTRIVFKILHAFEDKINYFRDHFNGIIIFLLRHPIPVAISRQFYPRLETFVSSDYKRYFTSNQLTFATEILKYGTKLEKGVLDWCFQNAVPIRNMGTDWLIISYEQLVLEPETIIQYLIKKLNFSKPKLMFSRFTIPSGSTIGKSDKETQKVLNEKKNHNKRSWLVKKWHESITRQQESSLMEILKIFDIDIYQYDSDICSEKFWIKNS